MDEWTLMLGLALGFAVLMCAAVFQVAKDLEWERDQDRREAKRLRAVVASLVMDRAEWQAKAQQYAAMLNDVAKEKAEDAAAVERIRTATFAKLDAIRDLPDWFVVGVEHAPIVLDRIHIDAALTDTAWFSTVEELTR